MKKSVWMLIAVALLFPVAAGAIDHDLYEDWETGTIDGSRWLSAGTPAPAIYQPGFGDTGYALDVNGDGTCKSAVFTVEQFETGGGMAVDFRAKGETVGAAGMNLEVGLTTPYPPGLACRAEGYFGTFAKIVIDPIAGLVTYRTEAESFSETYPGDDWHRYRFELGADGYVSFYRDEALKYSTVNPVFFDLYPTTRLQIGGQAAEGEMLVDEIALDLLGLCVPDFNQDGRIDAQDLIAKAEALVTEAAQWAALCYSTGLPCGDLDGDQDVDQDDVIIKAQELISEFVDWALNCWQPAKDPSSGDSAVVSEVMEDIVRQLPRRVGR